MRKQLGLVCALVALTACAAESATSQPHTPQQVIDAFHEAGLEANVVEEFEGTEPYTGQGIRFSLGSLCDGCGGTVFVLEDASLMELATSSVEEHHLLIKDDIFVIIDGRVSDDSLAKYEAALNSLE